MLIITKEITVNRLGRRIESVCCEKCSANFHYELTRVGVGKGSALYYVDQEGASKNANVAAQRDMSERLNQEAELVPCPKCHWVNQDLIDRYRRRQYRRAPRLILVIVVAGYIGVLLISAYLTAASGYNSRVGAISNGVGLLVIALSSLLVLVVRRQLRRRIDPNATYPQSPILPPGTPPALVETRDLQTGEMRLLPVARDNDDEIPDCEWAIFRPGQVRFPPVCCVCLANASTVYRSPLKVNPTSEVEVPLCAACKARLTRRWWLTVLRVAIVSMALAAIAAMVIPKGDITVRLFLFGTVALFATLIGGVVIAGKLCRPYRMGAVDADRGIVRFAARNPGFTAMLIKQAHAADGKTSVGK